MDCRTARLLLDYARPQVAELETSEREALEGHLAGCPECEGMVRSERRLDAQLSAAMRAIPIPDGLRERIQHRLDAERNLRQRRWLRRASTVAAGIAAAFLAIWFVVARDRTTLVDPQEFQNRFEYTQALESPEQVEQTVREQYGVAIVAPPQFDYHLCRFVRLTQVNKRQAVELVFLKPRENYVDEAHVFLLPEPEFKVENVSGSASGGRVFRSAVLNNPERNDVRYLVLYTGDNLEDFFRSVKTPAGGDRVS